MIQFALFVNRIRLYHCIKDMKRRKSQETSCVGQVSLRYYYHAELLVETRSFKVFNSSTSKQRKFLSQDKSSHWSPSKLIFTQWSTILKKIGTFFFFMKLFTTKKKLQKKTNLSNTDSEIYCYYLAFDKGLDLFVSTKDFMLISLYKLDITKVRKSSVFRTVCRSYPNHSVIRIADHRPNIVSVDHESVHFIYSSSPVQRNLILRHADKKLVKLLLLPLNS